MLRVRFLMRLASNRSEYQRGEGGRFVGLTNFVRRLSGSLGA